jgi:hypothetical protein
MRLFKTIKGDAEKRLNPQTGCGNREGTWERGGSCHPLLCEVDRKGFFWGPQTRLYSSGFKLVINVLETVDKRLRGHLAG